MTATTQAPAEDTQEQGALILREDPETTLEDVLDEWSRDSSSVDVNIDRVSVELERDDPKIQFGEHEVPATPDGLEVLARQLGMPVRYLLSAPADEQQFMFTRRLHREPANRLIVDYTSAGIERIRESGRFYADPMVMAMKIAKHLPVESPVRDHLLTANDLRLDVFAPEGYERFIDGDPQVNDLTHGGVRVYQNRKANSMPEVQTFMYRLVCTNGMEVPNPAIRIEGRRSDLEENFAVEFESLVTQALQNVSSAITSHYDMRSQQVDNDPQGTMRQMALDGGLSALVAGRLARRAASLQEPTMFDLTNMVTNMANHSPHSPRARTLQQAGGRMVSDHRARCASCHQHLR